LWNANIVASSFRDELIYAADLTCVILCHDYQGDEEGHSIVYTDPTEVGMMAEAVRSLGNEDVKVGLTWITKAPVEVSDEEFEKNMDIIDALEELDDVDSVDHNMSN
jgi:transcriptional/translational regulatory protein YebC/TACO1